MFCFSWSAAITTQTVVTDNCEPGLTCMAVSTRLPVTSSSGDATESWPFDMRIRSWAARSAPLDAIHETSTENNKPALSICIDFRGVSRLPCSHRTRPDEKYSFVRSLARLVGRLWEIVFFFAFCGATQISPPSLSSKPRIVSAENSRLFSFRQEGSRPFDLNAAMATFCTKSNTCSVL